LKRQCELGWDGEESLRQVRHRDAREGRQGQLIGQLVELHLLRGNGGRKHEESHRSELDGRRVHRVDEIGVESMRMAALRRNTSS
jgi:hypothetical protein